MTIKRLISLLAKCDPQAVVFVEDGSYGFTSVVNVSRCQGMHGDEQIYLSSSVVRGTEELRVSPQEPPLTPVDPHAQRTRDRVTRTIHLNELD